MQKFLLIATALLMSAGAASAIDVQHNVQTRISEGSAIQVANILDSKSLPGKKAMVQTCTDQQGRTFKRIVKLDTQGAVKMAVNQPAMELQLSRADAEAIAEGFESGEIPEGWTTISNDTRTAPQPWFVTEPLMANGGEGTYAAYSGSTFSDEEDYDEWLITPSFEVQDDYVLSFLGVNDLLWMVNFLYLADDSDSFTEYVPTGVLKIWAIDMETSEKTLIHDFFEDAIGLTFSELLDLYTGDFQPYTFSLADFTGKEIKIGFQNVGANGNSIYIDKVCADVPNAECSYSFPDWSLFWGLNRQFSGLNAEVAVLPVYVPLTWNAESPIEGASFIWDYYNNESEEDFGMEAELTETYTPDYSSIFSSNTNLFYTPILYCMADGYSLGSYQIYDYFQAGGRPDYYNSSKDDFYHFLLHCSNHSTEGFTDISAGDGLPAFGCGAREDGTTVNDFWSKYFTKAANATEDPENWAKFKGVCNFYAMPQAPLAINSLVGFFCGTNVNPEAVMTAEIAVLSPENEAGPQVIASATCVGSETELTLGESYFIAEFKFEKPVVLTPDMGDQFIITWTGFDDAAEKLAVMSNYWAPKNGINHGYAIFDIMNAGQLIEDGMLPLEAAIDVPGSFGIMIDGQLPWLVGDNTESISLDGDSDDLAVVALSSFYDGTELSVEAPEWVEATVAGRFGECALTVAPAGKANAEGTIKVVGPGVEYQIPVKMTSGISEISSDQLSDIVEAYSLQGVKLDASKLDAGIYIVRLANGSVRKAMIR